MMGFTLDVCELTFIEDDKTVEISNVIQKNICVSYNWGMHSNYWYIRDDMNLLDGKNVSLRLSGAIKKLTDEGIIIPAEDKTNPNWGWGLDKNSERLPDNIHKGIFLSVLNRLLTIADKYLNYYFIDIESRFQHTIIKKGDIEYTLIEVVNMDTTE